jgi:hypothetical protein
MATSNTAGPVSRADTELLIAAVRELKVHAETVTEQTRYTVARLRETMQQTGAILRQTSELLTAQINGGTADTHQRPCDRSACARIAQDGSGGCGAWDGPPRDCLGLLSAAWKASSQELPSPQTMNSDRSL